MAKHFQVDTNGTLTTSLVSYYNMQGNSNDYWGAYNGVDTSMAYGTSYGKVSEGANFNGSNSLISSLYLPFTATNVPWSIGFWFNTTQGQNYIFGWSTNGDGVGIGADGNASGTMSIHFDNGISNATLWTTNTYDDGTWHYAVITYSGLNSEYISNAAIYIDGTSVATSSNRTLSGGSGVAGTALEIGNRYTYSTPYSGNLDEVGIWNRVLSSTEITDLYNGGSGQTMVSDTLTTLTKNTQYAVKTTPAAKTKSLHYEVLTHTAITKSLRYAIGILHTITKSLHYEVRGHTALTKSLKYAVKTTPAAKTEPLKYRLATLDFSRQAQSTLPSTASDLSTTYSGAETSEVYNDSGTYVTIGGASASYAVHQFKSDLQDNTHPIVVKWIGQSSVAASLSAIYLQIFNNNSGAWETLASNTTSAANADVTLEGVQSSNLSYYYGTNNQVAVRVYQQEAH